MTPKPSMRSLVDPSAPTARSAIPLPFPLDVDLAPQLLVVALAHAALAATHRALDSAHPILTVAARPTNPPNPPNFTDAEHFAALVLHVAGQLDEILSDYAAAVTKENLEPDVDLFPF